VSRPEAPGTGPEGTAGEVCEVAMTGENRIDLIEAVNRHVESCVGRVQTVYHEIVSDDLHIDVHHVPPSLIRRFHVLVTSGMSALPMSTDPGEEEYRFAELAILLSPRWKLGREEFEDERNYWPVRLLKALTRYPRDNATWLGFGHSVALSNPPEPFASNTELAACVLLPSPTLGEGFCRMQRPDGGATYFWSVMPLYREELELKLERGTDTLLNTLEGARITDVVEPDRPSAMSPRKRRFRFF
jgi:hypothetical protein